MNELYIKNVSYSQVWSLMRDPGKWANERLLGQWDNTTTVAMSAWNICHKFVEHIIRTKWDETKALKRAYECIYTKWSETYIIDPDEFNKPIKELKLEEILENFKTKKLKFTKSTSMEVLLKKVKWGIDWYLSEKIHYWDILWVEQSMEHEITETILDKVFALPIPIKVIADQVCRTTDILNMVNWEKTVITIPEWSIYIEDTKFSDKFKALDIDSWQFFIQAMFLYYWVKKQYWEAPTHCNFRVTKTSKNRDWSSQQQVVTFFYSWDDFEIGKTDFWRYMMRWFELVQFFQDWDLIFNIFDMNYWDEAWVKQRAYYRWIQPDQLKQAISVSNRSKESSNNFSWHSFNLMDKWKEITEDNNVSWEIEIEDIVRTKLLEFWLPIQYEKTNQGYAYNQILFSPWRWVEMRRLESKLKELQQATGLEQIIIQAPVPWTSFIGIEYPRADRKYLEYSKYKRKSRGLKIPVWNSLDWKTTEIDLTDSNYPHLLVAGTTWSGKSEWLKVAIESLVWKCSLWLIDPKMVEFAEYEDRADKYLVWEKEVNINLRQLFYEMKKRYEIMKHRWVKDIAEYNKKTRNKLERIVIIIDEFWDLKHSAFWQEIEKTVEQITALWRAAWIHMIIATQRPDVKIINGRIRNNITIRVCLKVASDIDSKVILWKPWAEHLLGKWDLIFKDWSKSNRLQSFYIPKE